MKIRLWVLAGFTFVMSPLAHAGLSFYGGLHGGPLNSYTAPTPQDPVKGGLVGLNYGYQAGVDFEAGRLWTGAMFNASNIFADDYSSSTTPRPTLRYANSTVVLPLMFRFPAGNNGVGLGAYYAHPLTDESHRDSGVMLAVNSVLKGQIYGGVKVLGGLREYSHGGMAIQTAVSLGYRLK